MNSKLKLSPQQLNCRHAANDISLMNEPFCVLNPTHWYGFPREVNEHPAYGNQLGDDHADDENTCWRLRAGVHGDGRGNSCGKRRYRP
jgi:hypothetical protein